MTTLAAALLASLAPTLAIVANYLLTRRTESVVVDNASAIADIHVLVNSRLTRALDTIAKLEEELSACRSASQ